MKPEEKPSAPTESKPEAPKTVPRKTVKDVFEEFCEKGRKDRAYQTIRKQDSLWENHLKERFGHRKVDGISVAEITDYLGELYYIDNLSYMYVESSLFSRPLMYSFITS